MKSPAPEEYYLTGFSISHFALSAERLGVPALELLCAKGLDPETVMQPNSRLPLSLVESWFTDVLLASGDEYLGFHLGHQVMPGVYGAMTNLAFGAATVREAILVASRFQPITAGNMHSFELETLPDTSIRATWHMVDENPVLRRHFTDNIFALGANIARLIIPGPRSGAVEMGLAYPAPTKEIRQKMDALYLCPITFDAPTSYVIFHPEALDTPVNTHDPRLLDLAVQLAEKQLAEQQPQLAFADTVRDQIKALLVDSTPQRSAVAQLLGMSTRTLDRRLAENDTSWQQILDGLRARLAREYLADSTLSVQDISLRLGFADVRALQRRFRLWTGMSPSAYRQQLAKRDH